MADPVPQQAGAPEATTSTVTVASTDTQDADVPTLRVKLRKPRNDRKVQWTTETVDNEEMNKKKSKCCCIYHKPKKFDESSSEDSDDEHENCLHHLEKKKLQNANDLSTVVQDDDSPTATEVPPPEQFRDSVDSSETNIEPPTNNPGELPNNHNTNVIN